MSHTNAAIYLRISLDSSGEGLAVERQRQDCDRIARERGWNVTEVYVDNSISASKRDVSRPAYNRMVNDYKLGKFSALICYDLDRLTRQPRQLEDWIDAAEENGLLLVTANGEADLSNDNGRLFARIKASVARSEVERKSARQKAALRQSAAAGKPSGGRRAFGYEKDGITVRQDEAAAVAEAYTAFLSGVPLAQIARTWNGLGFVTGQKRYKGERDENGRPIESNPWHAYSVRKVLTNPRYMGKRALNGEIVADAIWPAIAEESTWFAVNAILNDPDRRHAPVRGRYLLSGLAVCGICGAKVQSGGGARRRQGYRCGGALGHFARMAEPVEDFVERVMVARLSRKDAVDLLHDSERPDVDALREESVAVRSRLDSLAVDFADGVLTSSQLRHGTERLRKRLAAVETRLAEAGRTNVLSPLVHAADVKTAWDAMDTSRKRAVISALARVTIHPPGRGVRRFDPETVEIEWLSEAA